MVLLTSRGLIDDGDVGDVDTAAEVRAMAANESWWRQSAHGDFTRPTLAVDAGRTSFRRDLRTIAPGNWETTWSRR